jgi:hypothetical protein
MGCFPGRKATRIRGGGQLIHGAGALQGVRRTTSGHLVEAPAAGSRRELSSHTDTGSAGSGATRPWSDRASRSTDTRVPEGRIFSEGDRPQVRQFRFISPGLFGAMGTPLVAGRDFTWTDVYERGAVTSTASAVLSGPVLRRFRPASDTTSDWLQRGTDGAPSQHSLRTSGPCVP